MSAAGEEVAAGCGGAGAFMVGAIVGKRTKSLSAVVPLAKVVPTSRLLPGAGSASHARPVAAAPTKAIIAYRLVDTDTDP
jgi:hypothetical protein